MKFFFNLFLILSGIYCTSVSNAVEIKDFRGKPVSITAIPKRVVALMPSLAEMIAELGHESALVGVPEYTNLKNKKNLGPYTRISPEMVLQLKPDLILASRDGNRAQLVETLEKLNAPVMVFDSHLTADILKTYDLLAKVFRVNQQSSPEVFERMQKLHRLLEADSNKASTRRKDPSVFLQLGWRPFYSASKNSFIGQILKQQNFINIFHEVETPYPQIGMEAVLAKNPEIILICNLTGSDDEMSQAMKHWEKYPRIRAVQDKNIFILKRDDLTKPSLSLIKGIERLKEIRAQYDAQTR